MKKIISVIMALVLVTCTFITASAQESDKTQLTETFKNVEDLRTQLNVFFNENYDTLYEYSKEHDGFSGTYETMVYEQNCGKCSPAFQKLLYENDMIVENMQHGATEGHMFNFLRVYFSDTPDKISYIVIDTTYKQFIIEGYQKAGYSYDEMEEDLPDLLVYEYQNKDQLYSELSKMKDRLGEKEYTTYCDALFNWQTVYDYIPHDFQKITNKSGKNYYTSDLVEKLRNVGEYEKKLSEDLYISSADKSVKLPLTYTKNGVYRCCIQMYDLNSFSSFYITNSLDEIVFGAENAEDTLKYIPPTGVLSQTPNDVLKLKKGSTEPISFYTYGAYLPMLFSLDLRAGEDTPATFAYSVNRTTLFGDTDSDGSVTIADVTKLQKVIAKIQGETLDPFTTETADVLTIGAQNILNATEIQRYLAQYETEKCGRTMYFSNTLQFSLTQGLGYIYI